MQTEEHFGMQKNGNCKYRLKKINPQLDNGINTNISIEKNNNLFYVMLISKK